MSRRIVVTRTGDDGLVTTQPTDLLGTWLLDREVEDRLADETREVTGTTTLVRVADDHVRWSEEGVMRWSGHEVPVERTLDVRRGTDGAWTVHFADGRPFHPWAVGEQLEHPCAPDHYRGRIDVAADAASWTVTWHSTGPAKDYVLRSRLTRAADRA